MLDVKDVAKGTPREDSLFEYVNVPDRYKTIIEPLYEDNYYDDYEYISGDEKEEEDFDISL